MKYYEVQEEMSFKDVSMFSYGGHYVQLRENVC